MHELDETDIQILHLLIEDARRPYREIAEQVDLSAPAVSDRIDRLRELGIIRQFTIHLDRDAIANATSYLLELTPAPAQVTTISDALGELDEVEDLFQLGDGRIVVHAHLPSADAISWLDAAIDLDLLVEVSIQEIVTHHEYLGIPPVGFDLSCVVCGNDVDTDGEMARFGDEIKAFCCESCLGRYEAQYESLADGV